MQNIILFVCGRKGSGKSTISRKIAIAAYERGRRVAVIDPMGCFELPGAPILTDLNQLCNMPDGRSFVFRPGDDQAAEKAILFSYIAGDLFLIVDEADLYLPASPAADNSLMKVVRYGRHKGISLCAVSQRPANVARDLTAQSDFILSFHVTEPRDVQYLAYRIGKSLAEELTRLPKFQTKIYAADTGGYIPADQFDQSIKLI